MFYKYSLVAGTIEFFLNAEKEVKNTLALKIIGIIIFFFILLFSLRAVITVSYSDEIALTVRVLFIKIRILPSKKKGRKVHSMSARKAARLRASMAQKAEKKSRKKLAKQKEKAEAKAAGEKKSFREILDIVKLITAIVKVVIKKFFRHLRVDVARLRIVIGTPDAATTAIAYGAASQSASYLFALLQKVKNVRGLDSADFSIETDFTSDTTKADIKISFSLRVWHVFDMAFGALGALIKSKFAQMKKADEKSSYRSTSAKPVAERNK